MSIASTQSHNYHFDPQQLSTIGPHVQGEWVSSKKLELVHRLYTSLKVEEILGYFLTEIQQQLPMEGISYSNDETKCNFTLGQSSKYHFQYNLQLAEQHLGELTFMRTFAFSQDDLLLLEDYFALLVFPLRNAIEHQHALQSALYDPLTGIMNRSGMALALKREIDIAKRHDHPLSIIAMDLDHFKSVNDNFGHSAGDQLLVLFSECLTSCVRESDMIFRVGGEEFIAVLSSTSQEGALLLAERIRANTEKLQFSAKGTSLQITVSCGISLFSHDDSASDLLERADMALYRAKSNGRNQVSL